MLVYGLRSIIALIIRRLLRVYNHFEIVGHENCAPIARSSLWRIIAVISTHFVCSRRCRCANFTARFQRPRLIIFSKVSRDFGLRRSCERAAFCAASARRQSLSLCRELLANPGNILIIFPEGTRSTTGEIGEFKSGIGALVAGRDVAVVPCFIDGTFRAWPKGKRFPRPRKVRLIVGEPRNYRDAEPTRTTSARLLPSYARR